MGVRAKVKGSILLDSMVIALRKGWLDGARWAKFSILLEQKQVDQVSIDLFCNWAHYLV